MGGSLAMGLKGHCARLIGFDSDPSTLEFALSKEIVSSALPKEPRDRVSGATAMAEAQSALAPDASAGERIDLLILATPVPTIIDILRQLPSMISYPCIVMDIGSTKRDILQAMSTLPENFDPIGGHPICGKEKLGLENADANLFQNAPFVVTPLERTTYRAKSAIQQIISAIGARQIEMNADNHDRILAHTSHLPFLISSSLARSTPHEFSSLIGSGFRSTSRLAATPSSMMMGVLKSNRENILNAIGQFGNSLHEMEAALQNEEYSKLEDILNQSRKSYLLLSGNY